MEFIFFDFTKESKMGEVVLNKMYASFVSAVQKPDSGFVGVRGCRLIEGKKFLVPSNDNDLVKEFPEQKIRMSILFKGPVHCSYFIGIGPIKTYLPYNSIDIWVSKNEYGENELISEKIPDEIKKVRDQVLDEFLKGISRN